MLYYKADIGVIGGSGLYELYPDVKKIDVDTPYGKTSDAISLVTVGDKKVAFMPRHGKDHPLNPSAINYRANIDAFAQLGIDLTLLRRFAASGNRTWRFCRHRPVH